jgi:hypothetical protein
VSIAEADAFLPTALLPAPPPPEPALPAVVAGVEPLPPPNFTGNTPEAVLAAAVPPVPPFVPLFWPLVPPAAITQLVLKVVVCPVGLAPLLAVPPPPIL